MTRENPDLTLRMYEAFHRRDLDAMLALMHDEIEIEPRLGALEAATAAMRECDAGGATSSIASLTTPLRSRNCKTWAT